MYFIYGIFINPIFMSILLTRLKLLPINFKDGITYYIIISIANLICEFIYPVKFPLFYVSIIFFILMYKKYKKYCETIITICISLVSFILAESVATSLVSIVIGKSVYTSVNDTIILITLMVHSGILLLMSHIIPKLINNQIFKELHIKYSILIINTFVVLYIMGVYFVKDGLKNQIMYMLFSCALELMFVIFVLVTIGVYSRYFTEKSEKDAEKKLHEKTQNELKNLVLQNSKVEEKKFINLKTDDFNTKFYLDDIVFFETNKLNGKVLLLTQNNKFEINTTLKILEDLLDNRFLRCHNSYIINMDKIQKIDYTNCIIDMEIGLCLIPKRRKMEIKEKICIYKAK